jgi:predicted MFS family arabinose efflux permease
MAGRIIDRRGGRPVLLASNAVFAAGLALLAWSPSISIVWIAWAILGVAMSMGLYDAAFATAARLFGAQARGTITGITLMGGFASTVGWPVTSYLTSMFGWRETCAIWAVIHVVMGLPLYYWLVPATHRAAAIRHSEDVDALPTRASPVLLSMLAYVFAAGWFVATAMAAHLPRVLGAGGVTAATAVLAGALIGPAQVAARLVEFGLLHRMQPLASARVAVLLHPIGALLFVGFGAPAAVFAIFHGAGNGLITIAVGTLPLALFGPRGYGFRQGLLGTPARVAQATAPFIFALLLERLCVAVLGVTSALLLLAFAALMSVGALMHRARRAAVMERSR